MLFEATTVRIFGIVILQLVLCLVSWLWIVCVNVNKCESGSGKEFFMYESANLPTCSLWISSSLSNCRDLNRGSECALY